MVHQIHKLLEQIKLIPGQNMEVQKLLFSFISWNYMHLVWFPCISCMEFRPPWSDFRPLAWKSDSSIPARCGSVVPDIKIDSRIGQKQVEAFLATACMIGVLPIISGVISSRILLQLSSHQFRWFILVKSFRARGSSIASWLSSKVALWRAHSPSLSCMLMSIPGCRGEREFPFAL